MIFNAKEIATLKENLATAEADVASAKAAHGVAIAERDSLAAQISALTTARDTALASLLAAQEKLTTQATTHAAEISTVNAGVETRIAAEVLNRCAAAGVDPVQVSGAGAVDHGDVLAKFTAIKDPTARTEFFRANRDAIYAARASKKQTR